MVNEQHPTIEGLEIRYTEPDDAKYLKDWLMDPNVRGSFPMIDEVEMDDAALRWISFCRYKCSLTATYDGVPCAIATLYLQPYRRISHQTEFGIVVGSEYRNKGIGSFLLNSLLFMAKEKFRIELIHLQMFENNPAQRLYEKFGFKEFGRQSHWLKDVDGKYMGRIFMERLL